MSIESLRQITEQRRWRVVAENDLAGTAPIQANSETVATYWIEAGHRMREQIADDALLCSFLRRHAHAYPGPTVLLYRGENKARYEARQIGLAWTPERSVAEMFARGINSVGSGGVVLKTICEPGAVISAPNEHSAHLQESQFTLDVRLLSSIEVITEFPPAYA